MIESIDHLIRKSIVETFFVLAAGILVLSCASKHTNLQCYDNRYMNITSYEVEPSVVTESGIWVDPSGYQVDLIELDRQVDDFEECSGFTVKRNCLTVKIASDWYVSPCSGQQVFPCRINPRVCTDKDIEITEECPCRCRAMIQDENTIVTTPNLYLFRGELARMVLGINNPWVDGISHCLLD